MDAGDKTPRVGLVVPLTGNAPAGSYSSSDLLGELKLGSSMIVRDPPVPPTVTTTSANYVQVVNLETGPEYAACAPFPPQARKTGLDFGAAADEVLIGLQLRYAWRRKDASVLPAGSTIYVEAKSRDTSWARQIVFMPGDEKKQCPVILVRPEVVVLAPQVAPQIPWYLANPAQIFTNPGQQQWTPWEIICKTP